MSKLGVCAIAKNENQYLEEWIKYHYLIGVRDFYLYDNRSDYPIRDFLKTIDFPDDINIKVPYCKRNDAKKQIACYNRIVNGVDNDFNTEWVAFIDIDEFVVPNTHYYLTDFVDSIDEDIFVVTWRFFVGFGYETKPDDLVINSYKLRQDKEKEIGKTIGKPEKMGNFINPHEVNGGPSRKDGLDYNKIQLNHYHVKSKEEFAEKTEKGGGDNKVMDFNKYYRYDISDFVEDDKIDKYVNDLKNLMDDVSIGVSNDKG